MFSSLCWCIAMQSHVPMWTIPHMLEHPFVLAQTSLPSLCSPWFFGLQIAVMKAIIQALFREQL